MKTNYEIKWSWISIYGSVQDSVTVGIWIASVSNAILVGVFLTRVGCRDAVILYKMEINIKHSFIF